MQLFNSPTGYGTLTKIFHWAVVALFAFQYVAAAIMLNLGENETALYLTSSNYFNWHKSLGLVALLVATARLFNRKAGILPDWAAALSQNEKHVIHIYENVLYAAMFIMPLSGFIYVMTGGYGVYLFELWALPNPFRENELAAFIAKWVHIACGYVIAATVLVHIALVVRHQLFLKDGLLRRMLP